MEKTLKKLLKNVKIHESNISMLLGTLVVVIVGALLYNYFSGLEKNKGEISEQAVSGEYSLKLEEQDGKMIPAGLPTTHTVQAGDHLWKISEKYYGNGYNWTDIARENNLSDPGLITAGQILTIPKTELKVVNKEITAMVDREGLSVIDADTYEVVKGDTLWSIAVRAYQDGYKWPEIYQANKEVVINPDVIEVGMVLTLPR